MSFSNLEGISLSGEEILTTFFSPKDDKVMILVLGENMEGKKEGFAFVYLYQCYDGVVDHGIEAFAFNNGKEAKEFVENIPNMSALDFMLGGLGVTPQIW